MKKNSIKTEKNNSKTFAFLPEVVLEHLKDAPAKEFKKTSNDSINEEASNLKASQTVVFDPMADPFDGSIIEIKPITKKSKKKSKKS